MVNPLPPPRNYRAKTRLARCRARQEATKKKTAEHISSSTKDSWLPFNSVPEVSSSWPSGIEEPENQESVEVSIHESFTASPSQWISAPIDNDIGKLPVIPLPAPSSMSQTRNLRNHHHVSPLQERDTNMCGSETFVLNSEKRSPQRKFVSRPIESSRGRNANTNKNAETRRSRSRSRTTRERSRSIMRNKNIERSKSDSSSSNNSNETMMHSNQNRDEMNVSNRLRSRSINARERSLSIIRARRKNVQEASDVTNRSASLSTNSRSNSIVRAQQLIKDSRTCATASSLPHNNRRGQSVDPHPRRLQRDNHSVLRRGQSVDPQSRRGVLENPAPNTTTQICGAMNNLISLPNPIHTRTLLTSSVYNNQATGIWITTINMNQKSNVTKSNAAKYLKAFSFQTEREARESAYANAPAKLLPFSENPRCFVCDTKFGVLRRASHCRNCGVVTCNSCCVSWSKQSIPETFNVKNESSVKVCKSCDSLSKMFRQALIQADYEKALVIYNTGNINLRCQFMTMKGSEAMLPIHCAAEGGSLELLQWLVDVHHCPIKRIRTSNKSKTQITNELITTSKGRNILEIAMAQKRVEIMNYLVNEKNATFNGIKSVDVALDALYAVLLAYPTRHDAEDDEGRSTYDSPATYYTRSPGTPITPLESLDRSRHTPIRNGIPLYDVNCEDTDDESTDTSSSNLSNENGLGSDDEQSVATTVHDAVSVNIHFSQTLNFVNHQFIFVFPLIYSVLSAMRIPLIASSHHVVIKFVV